MSGWSDEGAGARPRRAGTAGERPQKPLPAEWNVRPGGSPAAGSSARPQRPAAAGSSARAQEPLSPGLSAGARQSPPRCPDVLSEATPRLRRGASQRLA